VRFLIITFSQKPHKQGKKEVTGFCEKVIIKNLTQPSKKGVTGFCENVIIINLTQTRKKGSNWLL
jgi:hypothetical protein